MRSPVNRCSVCGQPIVKMVKVKTWDGYYLAWSKAKYCSTKCSQRAYRKRLKVKQLQGILGI